MRENLSIIKKLFFILLFVVSMLNLSGEPYKPYPVIFVHGLGSSSASWGAPTILRSDSIPKDSIISGHTYGHFLDYMTDYARVWYEYGDSSYTYDPDINPAYPNKTFLEVVNMDDPWGSIDDYYIVGGGYESPDYTSWQDELYHRVQDVLQEYYGDTWDENENAKVIIIGHSTAAPAAREMLRVHPDIVSHVHQLITADGVNQGSWLATPIWQAPGEFYNTRDWVFYCFANLPLWKYRHSPAIYAAVKAIVAGELDIKYILADIWAVPDTVHWWTKPISYDLFIQIWTCLELAGLPWDQVPQGAIATWAYAAVTKDIKPYLYTTLGSITVGVLEDLIGKKIKSGAIPDLAINSEIENNINSPGVAPPNIKYGFYVGREPWAPYWGSWWAAQFWTNTGLAALRFIPFTRLFDPWLGAKQMAATIAVQIWEMNTDLLVMSDHQDPSESPAFQNVPRSNIQVAMKEGVHHFDGPKQWPTFLDFIESPPIFYWTHIYGSKFDSISTAGDTFRTDTMIDLATQTPELGVYRPDSILGTIKDYFLAECKMELSINRRPQDSLTWENGDIGRLGYNGNKIVIGDLKNKSIFPGWNEVVARAVNMYGEQSRRQKVRFWYNPFLTYLKFEAPQDENCFQSSIDTAAVVYFSDNMSTLQAESLSVIFEDEVILDTAVTYDVYDSIPHHTLQLPFSTNDFEEGMYLVKAVGRNKENKPVAGIISFYIDDTPPEALIALPLEEDSVIHSSRVEDWMPFVFRLSDNLEDIIDRPKNEEAFIEITDSLGNLVWTDTIGSDPAVAGCYYNVPERIYWDFYDSDSKKINNSGKYNVIISCLDKAGNLGSDTSFFFLDNDSPEIEVVSQFDPIITSNEAFLELEYNVNEDAKIKMKWICVSGGETSVRDGYGYLDSLNHFFEGGDMYGNYINDGLYTPEFNAEDNVGNDTTYIEGIVQGDTLRVDRTPPSIRDLDIPWLVDLEGNIANVFFTVSEDLEKSVNWGEVTVKIYIDTNLVDSLSKASEDVEIKIDTAYDMSGYKNGVHKVMVTAEDQWGNKNTSLTEIVKGTMGTKITQPEEGDTLGQGWAMIKGLANDPDMNNGIPLVGFGLYYKQSSSSNWDSTRIIVPENLREPGIPKNRGNKPVPNVSDIARWNTDGLSGSYDLLLKSWEEGDSLILADTVINIFIESEPMTSPLISDFVVNIVGGSNNDTIFEPAEEETLIVNYKLGNKPADISFDVLNGKGRNMAHLEEKGIMPVSSSPPSMDREGLYLYFYDNKWWVKWQSESKFSNASGEIFSFENKSLSITDTITDTLNLPISFSGSSSEKIEFDHLDTLALDTSGFAFTGEGRIQFNLSFNKENEIWVGESKLDSPFVLDLASPFSYNGIVFGEGHIPGGRYTVRVSANGIDGMGYDDESDTITTETDLEIMECKLTSESAYPLNGIPASVKYQVNQKAGVKIDIYKGGDFFLNVENKDSVAGGRDFSTSWNGMKSDSISYDTGSDYSFKITAYTLPDFTDSVSEYSKDFSVEDSLPSAIGNFFIPPDYYVGEVHSDSVFNGKTDFLWEASAEGELYRPMIYKFADTAKGIREIAIDWEVEVNAWAGWGIDGTGLIDTIFIPRWSSGMPYYREPSYFYQESPSEITYVTVDFFWYFDHWDNMGSVAGIDTNSNYPDAMKPLDEGGTHALEYVTYSGRDEKSDTFTVDLNVLPGNRKPYSTLFCIEAASWGEGLGETWVFAKYNKDPYIIDSIFPDSYTIPGNLTEKIEIGNYEPQVLPMSEFISRNNEPDTTLYTYTLTTVIDGDTVSSSVTAKDPAGYLSVLNNGILVEIDNLAEGFVSASIYDPDHDLLKWKSVAIRTDTCYPIDGGGDYHNDTTKMSDLFIIPPDVDPTTVTYSDPVQIWEKKYVSLTKDKTEEGDSCIVATVKDWDPSWTSIEKDGCLTSSSGKLKGEGPFFLVPGFDFDGVSEKKDTFSSTHYSCQGTAMNYNGTFWYHGEDSAVTSNLYLNITNWNMNLFYPNGDINRDLFVDEDSLPYGVTPPKDLIATYGYEKGAEDYFWPFHFLVPTNVPRNYVEIDGHSEGMYYRLYEFDGKDMEEITNKLMNPVDSLPTKPLAYWNVTDVCGKRRIFMKLYDSEGAKEPFELRFRDFFIGSPYYFDSISEHVNRAHSPFYRAELTFDPGGNASFDKDTITSVSPVSINDMIDELSYNAPLLGEYKGPIVLLQPKGAKFGTGERPTFKYYYTEKEADQHKLDSSNVSLFAISDNGFLDDITSSAFEDTINKILILEASPDKFPGDGDSPFFVSLPDSKTVDYKPTIASISSTNIDSAKIIIKTDDPNLELLLIRCGEGENLQLSNFKTATTSSVSSPPEKKTINIYSAIEAFKNQSGAGVNSKSLAMISSRWDINKVDTMYIDVGSDRMWEGYINLESGDNYIFVGNREALLSELIKKKGTIKNCPVGFTKITLDITGPEIVFTRDPDPLISHIDDMESIAFYPTENAYINYIKFNTKGEIDDAQTFYSPAYDINEIYWDGKDEYGRLYEEGIYPYIIFGIDDFGNRSRDEKHRWEIRWGIPLEIVYPPEGVWLKGTQTLMSRIEGEHTYPVDWYKKWDETWGFIGVEDPSGEGLSWNTTFLPDEKNVWLKASVEDVFGHIGADSVRVKGIDNHPPEINTWVGEPSYLDEFISGMTPIFATAVDTFSGVDFFRYQIDGGSSTNVRDTFNLAGYTDGRHQIVFSARDHADNVIDSTLSLYLDNTSPFSQIFFDPPKKMYNDTLYISPSTPIWIEAQDTCGVAHSYYKVTNLDNDLILDWTEALNTFNIPYTPPDYRYIISYYSIDNLGNTESPKDTVVAIDCEPPVTILNIGDPRYPLPSDSSIIYITSQTPLSFEATDDISGVDTTYYRIDGAGWYVYSGGVFNLTEEGSHVVEYYSIDKAGNREDINSKELRVDETHPISELTTGDPNYELPGDSLGQILITSNTPLILTAEDPLSNGVASGVKEMEYEIEMAEIFAIVEGDSTVFTITGEDGSYKVDYSARDNVLNEEPANSKYYELDNTKPVAIILSPLDSTMVSDEITIIGTVNDKHFKEYVLEYGEGIDPGDWNTITVSDEEIEDSVLGKLDVSCIPGNIITVRLRATDFVENEAIDEVILWKGGLVCDFDIPLHKPEGVDFDIQGNIYATDREGGKKKRCKDMVKKFDPFGNLIFEIPDRYVPNDVAVTPWNNILISEQVRKEITEFDQSQEYIRSIKKLKGPDGVDAIRLPDSGMRCKDKEKGELKDILIGVADQTAKKVIIYDSLFNKIKEIDITKSGLRCSHHPEGISFDKEGNVYTCLINDNMVRKYDLDGNVLMEIKGFNKPSDVEVDYRGYIWVTDRNNDRIRCFDSYGNHLFKYGKKGKGCGEFNKPEGIAVNHERMYVADMNNDRVQVLRFPFSVLYPNLSSIGKTRQEALSIQECVPYPNPCDPGREFSNIRVVVSRDCEIEIRIYSLTGTLLWETAITGFSGINEVTWNGRNQDGEEVRNGVYNVLVRAKDGAEKDEERTKIIVYRR